MERRAMIRCALLLGVWLSAGTVCPEAAAAPPLQNASPLKAGGEKGYAPLKPGYAISFTPVGWRFSSAEAQLPDVFLRAPNGLAATQGMYVARFRYMGPEGRPVYAQPEKIDLSVSGISRLPVGAFFVREGKTLALWAAGGGEFLLTEYDPQSNALIETGRMKIGGLGRFSHMSVRMTGTSTAEVTVTADDGSTYFPKDAGGNVDAHSYYNGAGLFRGTLPRGGLRQVTVDLDAKKTVGRSRWLAGGDRFMLQPLSSARIGNGYVVTNSLGALRMIGDDGEGKYVWRDRNRVLTHPAQGGVAVAFPVNGGKEYAMMIGGESALYYYPAAGMKSGEDPVFGAPVPVVCEGGDLFAGSLAVPNVVDWNGDGVLDLVVGNSEGRLLFFRNRGTNGAPDFDYPEEICSAGEPICFRPGYKIVQGPMEAAWGYMCPTVFDWNGDGLPDVVFSGSDARFRVMLNRGTAAEPDLGAPQPLSVDNLELWGSWRVRPAVARIGGRNCLVNMDEGNALHLYWQVDDLTLEDGGRLELTDGCYITGHQTTEKRLGNNFGRGKLAFADWDGDGNLDLLVGCTRGGSYPNPEKGLPAHRRNEFGKVDGMQVLLFRNAGTNERMKFEYPRQVQVDGKDLYLGIHSNAPAPCGLGDTSKGINLLVGVESGKLMFFEHSHVTFTE